MRRKGRHGHAFLPGQLVSVCGWAFQDSDLYYSTFKIDLTAVAIFMEKNLKHEHGAPDTAHVLVDGRLGWIPTHNLHALGDDP